MHWLVSCPFLLHGSPYPKYERAPGVPLLLFFMLHCQQCCKVFVLCRVANTQEYFTIMEVMMSYPSGVRIRKASHPKITMQHTLLLQLDDYSLWGKAVNWSQPQGEWIQMFSGALESISDGTLCSLLEVSWSGNLKDLLEQWTPL